ncbi:hypothetical protein Bca52824_017335 [Brassica carinata]|uniref:No apical meristem-associated C-terminal domain-containing protein n=1 Tax=Brassica carinata TaxID=52824 RepID=A0A8X8AXB9_BRACI|nr:hypothetical protein Bca52824_017335 [Brassica carinata]
MVSNPYSQRTSYVDLLTNQQGVFTLVEDSASQVPVFGTEEAEASSYQTSHANKRTVEERPPGVKAAKGKKKKKNVEGKETVAEFQTMCEIKQQDLAQKERLAKMKLLDSLLAKQGPLASYEEDLKKKLINEFLSN